MTRKAWRRALGAALRPSRRAVAAVLLALVAAGFVGGGLYRLRIETGVDSFLPTSDQSLRQYQELAASFGGDAVVVLLESRTPRRLLAGDQLPKELALEGGLSRLPDVAAAFGPATTLNQIAGQAQNVLAELSGRRDGLRDQAQAAATQRGASADAVRKAGEDAVAEFDRRYGSLIVQGLPVGLPTLHNPQFVNNVIYDGTGQPRPQWKYVVPNSQALAVLLRPRAGVDQAGTERLVASVRDAVGHAGLDTSRVTVSGVPSLVAALGDEVRHEIAVAGTVAVVAIGLCLFLVPLTGRRRQRLLPLGVTLAATGLTLAVLGWLDHPISLGVVAFVPVLAGVGGYYPLYFLSRARSWVVVVVAGGTVASFGTLALAPLPFVRDLGLTLALGVCFAVAVGALVARRPIEVRGTPRPAPAAPASRRARITVGVAALALAAAGWALLPSLPLETSVQQLADGLPATADANHVEDVVGSSGELDVVLRGPDVLTPQAWAWLNAAQQKIVSGYGDQAHPVVSPPELLAFLGPTPTADQLHAGVRFLPPYLTRAVLRDDSRVALLSYGVRLDNLGQVRQLITSITADLPPAPAGDAVEVTGLPTVAVRGYDLISAGRYLASTAGVLAAGLVLLVGLRGRRRDALRAVASALLATGVELLGLGLTGTALNPVTVALGSLTAAVGCEFTVLMAESVRTGERSLRRAIGLAALTSGVGYAALAVSRLAVMREFAILLTVSVGLSYVAARLVVWLWPPQGPAGRVEAVEPIASNQVVGVS